LKILISNDDGIDSAGIHQLATTLRTIADVTVVAPLMEQSAVGHSITMQTPLRVIKYYKNGEFFGYAVNGSPADCVKMGIRNLMETPPDIVVSGINHGANTAANVIYSGTVSAAREAALMDYPAIAISIASRISENLAVAADVAKFFVQQIMEKGLKKGTLYNINVPDVPKAQLKGIQFTKQGTSKWDDQYEQRKDPTGRDYFWLTGMLADTDDTPGTDHFAIKNNYVAVTPVHFDQTDYEVLQALNAAIIDPAVI